MFAMTNKTKMSFGKNQKISSILKKNENGELLSLYLNSIITPNECLHLIPKLFNNHASSAICKSLANREMTLFFSKDDYIIDVLSKIFLFESFIRNINVVVNLTSKLIEGGYQVDFHAENNPLTAFTTQRTINLDTTSCSTPNNPYFFVNSKHCGASHLACSFAFQLALEEDFLFLFPNMKDLHFNQILAFQLGYFVVQDINYQLMMVQLNKERYKACQEDDFFNRFIEWEESIDHILVD